MSLGKFYEHMDKNLNTYIEELREFLRIPGFSATGEGIEESANAVLMHLKDMGCEGAELLRAEGNPVVYGKFRSKKPGARTLLVYTFYDLIPVTPERWTFPPLGANIVRSEEVGLNPAIGKVIVSRGARDHRGPTSAFLSACKIIKKVSGDIPLNIIFTIEGEEEIGSPNLRKFRDKYADRLTGAEAVFFPNLREDSKGRLTILRGTKGMQCYELEIKGGEWGGTIDGRDLFAADIAWVDAPIPRLIRALNTLFDENDRPTIDGFWENVIPPSKEEQAELEKMIKEFNEEGMKEWMGIRRFKKGFPGKEYFESLIMNPWLNIDGLIGGYTGERIRTILPMEARAKIDVRIVPNMTPDEVFSKLRKHLDKRGFKETKITKLSEGYSWNRAPGSALIVQSAIKAAEKAGMEYVVWPTLPSCVPLEIFNLPGVVAGAGNTGRGHRQDEYLSIQGFSKAIKYYISFLHEYGG
jgi:acetylornithine deacetylase/succinyl-diaminopimelate desuccinylase-like protein